MTGVLRYKAAWWSDAGADTRRWAWFNIGAYMCAIDTGRLHGPVQWLEPTPRECPVPQHIQDRMFTPVGVMRGQTGMEI